MFKFAAKYDLRPVILMAVALVCLITGSWLLFARYKATSGAAAPPKSSETVTEDIAAPSENKVTNDSFDKYNVPADQPRSILLPSIEAKGLIQKVGLTKDNAIATPSNINFAGWYTSSVKPGEAGLSIIDGHVSGKYADGVFKRLKNLKENDKITVEFGDRSARIFQVVSVTTVPEADAAKLLFDKHSDIPQQLNLITCGGKFDKSTQTYADRVVVVAKLAG